MEGFNVCTMMTMMTMYSMYVFKAEGLSSKYLEIGGYRTGVISGPITSCLYYTNISIYLLRERTNSMV